MKTENNGKYVGKPGHMKYVLCIIAGFTFFLLAEIMDGSRAVSRDGTLRRNEWGQGDAVYEFYVDGLEEGRLEARVTVPEQKLSEQEFEQRIPEIADILCVRILGENSSLTEVRTDLELMGEIPEYGVTVSWESEQPDLISHMGIINREQIPRKGADVFLTARLTNGTKERRVDIPIRLFSGEEKESQRFLKELDLLLSQRPDEAVITLPKEFEGKRLKYGEKGNFQNAALILFGFAAAAGLRLKEKTDQREAVKKREDSMILDYPDLVSEFLILTGAGYSTKQAWKKIVSDREDREKGGLTPAYEEMQIALNQMETGISEVMAYKDFGRRCGLRCYMKFSSILESNLHTGGKNLRKLLEEEMEEAFRIRADLARRRGEEASSKLLAPMFGILGVVMVMVTAPALFSLG